MGADDLDQTQDQPIDSAFPFASYRPYQREILAEAAETLFGANAEYDNLVIYAPTGIGKSPINVALTNLAKDAFYTTPQKKLRHQLATNDVLREHYQILKAREDYDCEYASHPGWLVSCAACPIYHDDERACRSYTPGCGYWDRKELAMESRVATLTFSYLVADGYLDTEVETSDVGSTLETSYWRSTKTSGRRRLRRMASSQFSSDSQRPRRSMSTIRNTTISHRTAVAGGWVKFSSEPLVTQLPPSTWITPKRWFVSTILTSKQVNSAMWRLRPSMKLIDESGPTNSGTRPSWRQYSAELYCP